MLVEVKTLERLIIHYLWILEDVPGARERLKVFGASVDEEKRLGKEIREWLDEVKGSGRRAF